MPRVSILIPTYSRPERLRGCVEAALASTFEDIEVIVGDDGSLGRAVCEAIDDPRLRYVANEERLGMASNWNALLDRAGGRQLALCMDDDRLAPSFAQSCVARFDADPELGVVFTNHTFDDDDGATRTRASLVAPGRHDRFARELMLHVPVAVSAAMLTRSAWEAVRPLPNCAAADMVLFGRIAELGHPFFYVDAPLMSYRIHSDMLSGTPGFRDDVVAAWSALRFSDPVAESQRRRRLGDALTARARLSIQHGAGARARADLRTARAMGIARRRLAPLHAAAFAPASAIAATARLRRRLRAS